MPQGSSRQFTFARAAAAGYGNSVCGTQAILDLPTVGCGGVRGLVGRHGLEPWSESIDGEDFLEILLLLVIRSKVRSNYTVCADARGRANPPKKYIASNSPSMGRA